MASICSTHIKNARKKNTKEINMKKKKTPKKRTFIKCKVVVKTRPSFTPVFIFLYIFSACATYVLSYSLQSTHTRIIFNSTLYVRRKCYHLICSYSLDIGVLIVLCTLTICAVRGKIKYNPLELSFSSCYSIFFLLPFARRPYIHMSKE